ncbi:MAG: hypothetical protein ACXAE3_07780 [Candidatus Kariarchaeaceae archaeon]
MEDPIRNITKLPQALLNLPMNAVLHQSWNTIFSLFGILFVLGLPSFILLITTASLLDKTGLGISLVIFILIGLLSSFIYLKSIYGSLNGLVESRKAPWLVQKIKKPFNTNYQRDWSTRVLGISLILPLIMEIPLIWTAVGTKGGINVIPAIIWLLFLIVGHVGISLMIFVSLLSVRYINVNTAIYDQVLLTITDRVRGYTEGHESILNKKNYEVVGVLSDTPGLSIRNLGDIPIFGLGSGIFSVNALIFLLFSPFFLDGPLAVFLSKNSINPTSDVFGITWIILGGIFISSIFSFGAVIGPLGRITRVMRKFKIKALTELDPFIFEEITGVALRKDTQITNETQVLFMLRNYIYTMKVSPVNPFRLIQIILLTLIYSLRILPAVVGIFSGGA